MKDTEKNKTREIYMIDEEIIKENVEKAPNLDECGKKTLLDFSTNLNEELVKQEITQDNFRQLIGIAPGTLSNYRSGKRLPTTDVLVKIAKELNVSTDYLLGLSKFPSIDDDFKVVNQVTGLENETIEVLNEFNQILNDKGIKYGKEVFYDRLRAINFLIQVEKNNSIFWNVSRYFWHNYKNESIPKMLEGIDQSTFDENDLQELKKFNEDKIEVRDINSGINQMYTVSDLNRLSLLNIEDSLNRIRDQVNEEQK